MRTKAGRALRIGWESAKANAVPTVCLWTFAFLLALGYFLLPPMTAALEAVGRWQREGGWLTVVASRLVFNGALPGAFLLAVRSIRPRRPFATIAAQTAYGCAFGLLCDAFFRLQGAWFGEGRDVGTLVMKTLVDQFAWTVLVIAPANAAFFFWLGRDLSWARTRREWPRDFVPDLLLPNLLPNWIVSVPAILATYTFPVDLQVHVNGLVSAFWMLVCLQIGRRSVRRGRRVRRSASPRTAA